MQSDPWTREGSYSADLLNMIQFGQQPLQVYAPVERQQPLIRSLGQILQNGHTIFGSFRLYNAGRYTFRLCSGTPTAASADAQ